MKHISKFQIRKIKAVLDEAVKDTDQINLNTLFARTYKNHWEKRATAWSAEAKKVYERSIRDQIGHLPLNKVTPKLLRSWLYEFEKTPIAGNRALAVLSKMFSYAESEELIPLGQNPCQAVVSFPEVKRDTFATKEDLTRICEILKAEYPKKTKPVTLLLLLMYTGARPSVFINAKWTDLKEVFIDGKTIGVLESNGKSTSRTGQKEKVVIPPAGMELVNKLTRDNEDGRMLGIPLPHAYWKTVVKRAKCPDLWIRDLRRTFATVGLSNGVSLSEIGEILNHKSAETTKIYAKLIEASRISTAMRISHEMEKVMIHFP